MVSPAEGATNWVIAVAGSPDLLVWVESVDPDGAPIVDVSAVAAALELTVFRDGSDVGLRTSRGREWRVSSAAPASADGPSSASAPGARPPSLSLAILADLCDMRLVVDPAGRAFLFPRGAAPDDPLAPLAPATGLETITVPKSAAEREESRRAEGGGAVSAAPLVSEVLPPTHEALHVQTGIGSVLGADWAGELGATGSIAGVRTDAHLFATLGTKGVQYRYGGILLQPRGEGWSLQAGDLMSELRGVARGLRLGWGARSRWRHGVSLERHDPGIAAARWLLAYRTELALSEAVAVGAEAASDGSLFLKSRYARARTTLDGFWRHDPLRDVREAGGLTSYELWRGVSLGAGIRTSSADERSYLAGVNIPLQRFGTLSLQQTRTVRGANSQTLTGVAASLPLGPMRLFQRFGWSDMMQPHAGLRTTNQQYHSMASYAPSRRAQLTYQSVTQWYPGGDASVWDEITMSLQVTASTALYTATAVPQVLDWQRFRVRLTHKLGDDSSLSVEFGQVPTFQSSPLPDERPRLLVMMRRGFGARTPARGGEVSGRVLDEVGRPVAGAAVRLGDYVTATREDGTYKFRKVPSGHYALSLDAGPLPANYAAGEGTELTVTSRTSTRVDLGAVPLNSIRGAVYVDRDGDGRFDRGEQVSGVVVGIGERLTVTDGDGRYGFYNLAPGRYVVRVDASRLRHDLEVTASSEAEVPLQPDGPVGGVLLAVKPKVKPVRMQEGW